MQTDADIATPPDAPRFSVPRFLRAVFIEGGRFWERGRLAFNGVQLLLTAIMLVVRWSKAHYFADNLGTYIAFAIMANILYTAAYLPEAILQIPQLRRFTVPVRWCVLIAGTVITCFLTVAGLDVAVLTDPAND
jgi:hypothetical protein